MTTERELVLMAIEAGIKLDPSLDYLMYTCNSLIEEDTEEYSQVCAAINHVSDTKYQLIDIISDYTGVYSNDFIGDGFYNLCDEIFNGDYTAEQILDKFESIDIISQRKWVIEYNLNYLVEYNEKVKRNIDKNRSREIFDARFKLLIDDLGVPVNKKLKYANLLLDYVNGKKSLEYILENYKFYIHK